MGNNYWKLTKCDRSSLIIDFHSTSRCDYLKSSPPLRRYTVKILKFGTPQTIALIVLKIEKFDVTMH